MEINYTITTDPILLKDEETVTPELLDKLQKCHQLALEGKRSSIQLIQNAIEEYPDNPQLKNYLSVLYNELNETQKMYDVNKWIIAEHPNYLFGKLNLANEYYLKKEYDKMPNVHGPEMDLKALYPNRDTFHINEVTSFLKSAVLYFTAIDSLEEAEIRYELLNELAPNTKDTELALNQIFAARIRAGQKRYTEEKKNKISVITKKQKITNFKDKPIFNHPEIEWLYSIGLYIEEEKLNTILSLPKVSLIQDLESVLQDSINRYDYFQNLITLNAWEEEKMTFAIHALYLLGEIGETKSLPSIFNVLSQSDDYLEFYFGDFLTSTLWEPLYKITTHDFEPCKQFVLNPSVNTYAKSIFLDIAQQIALHHPERRNETLNWFSSLIEFFLNSTLEDNVIDSDLIAFLICNVIDINGIELLPEIEKLLERKLVSLDICGDLKEVRESFELAESYNKKRTILSIKERYEEITSTWAGYNEEDHNDKFDYFKNFEDDKYFESLSLPVVAEQKIGRNAPCPCGSGKKYKKCCLNID